MKFPAGIFCNGEYGNSAFKRKKCPTPDTYHGE
jgi:hypothetical protein